MSSINGPTFLVAYLLTLAILYVIYLWIRRGLSERAARDHRLETAVTQITSGEVGYLQGAAPRTYAVRAVALREGTTTVLDWERKHVDPEGRLEAWGLLLDRAQRNVLQLWGAALYGSLLAAGIARLWGGIVRDKPVGLLILLLALTAFVLWHVTRPRMVVTRLGRDVVAVMTERYRSGVGDTSYAMGYALLGATALTPELTTHLRSEGLIAGGGAGYVADTPYVGCSSGNSSGSGSSCSSDGGGGGCGGCGGD